MCRLTPSIAVVLIVLASTTVGTAAVPLQNLLGFSGARVARHLALEEKFDSLLDPADQRAWMERMAAEPNHIGSTHNKANAEFVLERFKEWGWDAKIETFQVLYPTPKKVALQMVAPTPFTARLQEPAIPGDRASANTKDALPPYLVYGADGDVTADLVYVNQGMPNDYLELERRGIDVKGRIVIVRYGGGWRGLKPKLAHEHGAVGCIIYSDPIDDGYGVGDVYPKGGYRPADGVQRGSVLDMPIAPGDPLTPGVGATNGVQRLPLAEAKTILKIPALPISYSDAQPLLAALGGPVAPANWRGALPITYHLGPGPAKVRLTISSDWGQKEIFSVIATIQGNEDPNAWIVRGNHRDGWVFGAWDPLSAHVAMMSEAKAIGALVKQGWKPKRTIIYASWDGEEAGLLGSTEWVESHAHALRRRAALYVNSDSNGRGFLKAGGSHSVQHLLNQVATAVRDPATGTTVLERLRAKMMVDGSLPGADEETRKIARKLAQGEPPPLNALGSGSDYSPFLQHLGIASLNLGFGGEDHDSGIYHSAYDSFDHFVRFGDPDFTYGIALSKIAGRVMLRMADSDVLPLRFTELAATVGSYLDEVRKLADDLRERTEQQNRLIDENAFKLASDPAAPVLAPKRESPVPTINFAPLDQVILKLKTSATACDAASRQAVDLDPTADRLRLFKFNVLLLAMEQTLTHFNGLPGREWYHHMIYAPGLQTGYGVKTLPGIREAIEQRRWSEADQYIKIVVEVLSNCIERMDNAAAAVR
ncbi:MAG: M28 family peptidase [Opitutaceae bacterium]|nr:M28 family peptidase [Verrucomicrobiales bacterium]